MAFPTCTADDLGSRINCLKCLDTDHLIAILVRLGLDITGVSLNPDNAQLAHCMACYSDDDFLRMLVVLAAEYAVKNGYRASWTVEELRDETKCYNCTDTHKLRASLVLLVCEFLSAARPPA